MSSVELVYIPEGQKPIHQRLDFSPGLTVAMVIAQSRLVTCYPEIAHSAVGIFARVVAKETCVRPGDRIEIYRPLLIDPKEKRRQRSMGLEP